MAPKQQNGRKTPEKKKKVPTKKAKTRSSETSCTTGEEPSDANYGKFMKKATKTSVYLMDAKEKEKEKKKPTGRKPTKKGASNERVKKKLTHEKKKKPTQEASRTCQEPSRGPEEDPTQQEQSKLPHRQEIKKKAPIIPPKPPAKVMVPPRQQPPVKKVPAVQTSPAKSRIPVQTSSNRDSTEDSGQTPPPLMKVASEDDLHHNSGEAAARTPVGGQKSAGTLTGSADDTGRNKRLAPHILVAMDDFFKQVMLLKWNDVTQEFRQLEAIKPTATVPRGEMTTAYDPAVPCLVNTCVQTDGVDFYHASRFVMPAKSDLKDIRFILGQAPPTERAVEDFWATVFQAEPALLFLLAPLYEDGGGCTFFQAQPGEYENYGHMMVTTKRAETFKYGTSYLFEVLPEGCSNALFVKMIHYEKWEPRVTPSLRGFLQLMRMCRDVDPAAPVMCISRKGTGRPAVLAAATTVYNRLLQGVYTPVHDVAIHLRNQRAAAFENTAQYSFVYVAVAGYIKRRTGEAQWADLTDHMSQWGPELAKQLEQE